MGCCGALINLTLCLVLNLAIFNLRAAFLDAAGERYDSARSYYPANLAKNYYTRLRTEAESCVPFSAGTSGKPVLPRYRRAPARLDDGAPPHHFKWPKDYYRVQYYEACDKIKTESESWFKQAKLKPASSLEKLLVGAVNSDDFSEHLEQLQRSCFGTG